MNCKAIAGSSCRTIANANCNTLTNLVKRNGADPCTSAKCPGYCWCNRPHAGAEGWITCINRKRITSAVTGCDDDLEGCIDRLRAGNALDGKVMQTWYRLHGKLIACTADIAIGSSDADTGTCLVKGNTTCPGAPAEIPRDSWCDILSNCTQRCLPGVIWK